MSNLTSLENLIIAFEKFPGIGHRTAERLAYYVLSLDKNDIDLFSSSIVDAHDKIHHCPNCGMYTEKEICEICSSDSRENNTLVVVASSKDAISIEKITQKYKFHVLNGELSMLKGITPDKLNIEKLLERIEKENIKELILATNPTIEGETTSQYICNLLVNKNITISRLAYGLPMGGEIDYLDSLTIDRAFTGRTKIK